MKKGIINNIKLSMEKKCTRKNFEKLIREKFNTRVIQYSPYKYCDYKDCDSWGDPKLKSMTLYYHKDVHIASWQKGLGWFIKEGK